jgi:hypothetical protein
LSTKVFNNLVLDLILGPLSFESEFLLVLLPSFGCVFESDPNDFDFASAVIAAGFAPVAPVPVFATGASDALEAFRH